MAFFGKFTISNMEYHPFKIRFPLSAFWVLPDFPASAVLFWNSALTAEPILLIPIRFAAARIRSSLDRLNWFSKSRLYRTCNGNAYPGFLRPLYRRNAPVQCEPDAGVISFWDRRRLFHHAGKRFLFRWILPFCFDAVAADLLIWHVRNTRECSFMRKFR